jgi:hypothetical protein
MFRAGSETGSETLTGQVGSGSGSKTRRKMGSGSEKIVPDPQHCLSGL